MAKARALAILIIGALMLSMVGPHLALADAFGKPVNFAPVDNATDIGPTSPFEFTNTPDGDGDSIYASQWQWRTTSGDYAQPLYDTGIFVSTLTRLDVDNGLYPEGVFAYNTKYYWRVRVQNDRGEWSAWSDETCFTTIANLPPSQPQNFSPTDNATEVVRNPVLAASEFRDPNFDREELVLGEQDQHVASQWQIAANGATGKNPDGSYAAPVFDSGEVSGSDELTSFYIDVGHLLAASSKYYFHVRYKDSYINNSNWSAWSDETYFTTGTTVSNFSQPVNMSPFDGAPDISPDHQLQSSPFYAEGGRTHLASQWEMAAASAHGIDAGDGSYLDPIFASPIDTSNLTVISMPTGVVALEETYYWHVRYQDNLGAWSDWSDETSFTIVDNHAPGTPVNQTPLNAATDVSATPVLGASAFSDADVSAYTTVADSHAASQWQVRASAGAYGGAGSFDSQTVTGSDQLTSFYIDPANDLELGTSYYWHVRYQDSFGEWSDWSAETSFTTMTEIPDYSLPVNVSPFNGATDISPDHRLQSSPFYTGYGRTHLASQWQVTTVSGDYSSPVFGSPIDTVNLTAISLPAGTLELGGTYYWHVRYQDDLGDWSVWSDETSFTIVDNHAPGTPVNQTPLNAATGVSVTPVLGASPFSDLDASAYTTVQDAHAASQWQVRTSAAAYGGAGSFDSGIVNGSDQLTSFYIDPANDLALGTSYCWHVRYQDSFGGWSEWSAETSFSTVTSMPDLSLPVNVSPFDGATEISPDQPLQSSLFYTGGGRTHFASQWQMAAAGATGQNADGSYQQPVFSSSIDRSNLTAISMPVGIPSLGGNYYWHVRYQDDLGTWSDWSVATSFTIVPNRAPSNPVNKLPLNAASEVPVTPVLGASPFSDPDAAAYAVTTDSHAASQWQARTSAGSYASPAFDSGTVTGTDQLTSCYIGPDDQLALNTTYYWHVRYRDSFDTWSSWSAETSFTTVTAIPDLTQPVNVSPFDGATEISPDQPLQASAFYTEGGRAHFASQWQVRTSSGSYSSPVFSSQIDSFNLVSISVPAGTLDLGTTYYWHVRYQDNLGAWSAWSDETSFTLVANRTPETPVNSVPAGGATGVSVTPTLGASPFSDPDTGAYSTASDSHAASQWQVRTSSGSYSSPAFDSGTVTGSDLTGYYIGPDDQLAVSTKYYWHVRYQDSFGLWSGWSSETTFTTAATIPDATQPVNVSPYDGAAHISPDHPLQSSLFYGISGTTHQASYWQVAAAGATDKNADGSYQQPLFDSRIDSYNLVSIVIPTGIVDYGATYYWHVRYQDSTGAWSEWSDETSFTVVVNMPPSTPVNVQPAHQAADLSLTPVLTASGFSDYDVSAYAALSDSHMASQWQLRSSSGTYTSPVWDSGQESAAAASVEVPAGELRSGTVYYWHVRYQDSHGNWSAWSLETSFTTRSISAPVAAFTADKTRVVVGVDLVTFTDNSTPAADLARWTWDFGDGTTENWTALTRPSDGKVVHKYASAVDGNKVTVKLTVYNAGSTTGVSKTMTVTVRTKPAAGFEGPQSGKAGAAITVTDSSTPSDGITTWVWWFDDGETVTWASPEEREAAGGQVSHVFAKAGLHTVSLTVKGELGESYLSQEIKVTGGGGLHFGLWMIGVALALVAVPAGGLYLLRNRKIK